MALKKSSQKIDEAVSRSNNFELTIADIAKRSERRAWWVAITAIVMALILLGGYFYMLPLKEKVPYVIMADAYTGTSSVARLTEDFTNHQITTSEAINKSNVAHYVMARESYDSATTAHQRDWITTFVMSSSRVRDAYKNQTSSLSPDNPAKIYADTRAIRINILSIVLRGGGVNEAPKGATVRFQRSVYDKQSGATQPLDSKIATLEFTYQPTIQMDDQYRIENPLGFQVTDYRIDNDYESTAPAAASATQLSNANMSVQPATGMVGGTNAIASSSAGIATAPGQPMPQQTPPQGPIAAPQGATMPTPRTPDNGAGR